MWDWGLSVVENSHGGVSKQDSVVPIDTVAVPNWCFLIRCCTSRVAASFDLTYYPGDRRNLLGAKGYSGHQTSWSTLGGNFITKRKALIDFKFPELSTHKTVTWICHVDEKTSTQTASYDMIIGMDLMIELGITVDTASKTIRWNGAETPLKQKHDLCDPETLQVLYHLTQETRV